MNKYTLLWEPMFLIEFKEKREEFIILLIYIVILKVYNKKLAESINSFCEKGDFSPEECKKVLQAEKEHRMESI